MNLLVIIALCVLVLPELYGLCLMVGGLVYYLIERKWPGRTRFNRDQAIVGMIFGTILVVISTILALLVIGMYKATA